LSWNVSHLAEEVGRFLNIIDIQSVLHDSLIELHPKRLSPLLEDWLGIDLNKLVTDLFAHLIHVAGTTQHTIMDDSEWVFAIRKYQMKQ
jgi:hypothetical protein